MSRATQFFGVLVTILVFLASYSSSNAASVSVERKFQIEKELKNFLTRQSYIVMVYYEPVLGRKAAQTGFLVNPDGYILTAAHGDFSISTNISVTLKNGKKFKARFVDEIQTSDIAILSIDQKVNTASPFFVDLRSYFPERGEDVDLFKNEAMENYFTAWLCASDRNFKLVTNRIYIGEVKRWNYLRPEILVRQLTGDLGGCSGAPAITRSGKILGIVRSSVGDTVVLIDAEEISRGADLIIRADRNKKSKRLK